MTELSLIIPAYNEAESLPDLLRNIDLTVKRHGYAAEIIFINDGSTDATADVLDRLASQSQIPVHIIHFRRNRGKAAALTAGFQHATGDIVSTMDADLQPDEIIARVNKVLADAVRKRDKTHETPRLTE